jgi:hypothetical protein
LVTAVSEETYEGLRGPVAVPSDEAQARKLLAELEHRIAEGRRKLMQLAEERAGTEKLREQVVEALYRWFIHRKPKQPGAHAQARRLVVPLVSSAHSCWRSWHCPERLMSPNRVCRGNLTF